MHRVRGSGSDTAEWRAGVSLPWWQMVYWCTVTTVNNTLAPVAGPSPASHPQDPNSDLKEIFDTLESLPTAPLRLLQGLASWARGDDDPDWGAKGRKKQQGGGRK